ncbi:PQQ-dependent sugar dehydrogenase [Streptomyces sannanensis]
MTAGLLVGSAGTGRAAPLPPRALAATEPVGVRTVSTGWTVPWGLGWLPDGSALIGERNSLKLFRLTRSGDKKLVGTVPHAVSSKIEEGLMGIAVSPTWQRDHYIYLLHTAAEGHRIARMTYDGSRLGGYRSLLTGIKKNPTETIHNGGRLKFGPDGYLYAATGDALRSALAQDKNSLNGKILRLTVDGRPAPGNPFGNYVYSYGHRNPQGLAFDAQGRLWSSEIGNFDDELNLIRPGRNYGWPLCKEGACTTAGMTNPKAQWKNYEASPSGLTYAAGSLYMAAMHGKRLWRIPVSGTTVGTPVAYYTNKYGRLRTVEKVPGRNALWLSTTNTDRNGHKPAGEDKVLEVTLGLRGAAGSRWSAGRHRTEMGPLVPRSAPAARPVASRHAGGLP